MTEIDFCHVVEKKILYLTLAVASTCSLADVSESSVQPTSPATTSTAAVVNNSNASFIGRYNYFQNPYGWMLSGGGTSKLTESEIKEQNWAEKLFAGGTYNVFTGVTYNQWDGQYASSGKSYGANVFAQTGQLRGFSIGGVQVGWSYSTMWQLNLSANTMWGASGSYNGGAFVSPYTQSLQVDPLYSEAWSYNMVTTGQPGNMYKVQGQFGLGSWGQNLIFQPSYVYVGNNNPTTNGLQELDLVLNYPLPQVRGLYLFGVYAQQWYNPNAAPAGLPDNNYQPIEIQSGVYYTW
ncbi:MAG TPA: hypothetical protein PLP75_08995 [Burkholderiales bacterium]|nr:hypothetical protein [Burkholderiales bacterium]